VAVLLEQRPVISLNDVDMAAVDYTKYLRARISELLIGTPTAVSLGEVTDYDDDQTPIYDASNTDLTISNVAVSTAVLDILTKAVDIGKAVQFKVIGQKAGKTYGIRITASTNSTPARTKVVDALLIVAK